MMKLYMDNYANPIADQWYRSLSVAQRLMLKATFIDISGVTWEDAGTLLSMRERIAIYHGKLVAEGVIRPCGYGAQYP
jgi:hypothetical protein